MELKAGPERATLSEQESKLKAAGRKILRGDILLRWLTSLMMLVFPTAVLLVNRADSYTFWLLVLIGIWVWLRHGARPFLDRWSGALLLAFAVFFGVTVLAYLCGLQTQDGFRFLGRYLRFLFIAPVYLAFRRYPPTAKTVFIGLAVGALAGGVVSIWHFLHVHYVIRMEAATDLSIIFGDLATTMVLCTVAGFGLMAASRRTWSVPLLILCLAGGVAATLLSGTRGAWIPLFLLPLALMTPLRGGIKRRYLFAIVTVIVMVCSSFYFIASTGTQRRLLEMVQNTRNYFIGIDNFNSYYGRRVFKTVCENQNVFLRAWLERYNSTNHVPYISGGIEQDPLLRNTGLCQSDYALILHSFSNTKSGWFVFPRLPLNEEGAQVSKILVRGVGTAVVGGSGQVVSQFDTKEYALIALWSKGGPGITIGVGVPPGKAVWLVPVDGYPGEYGLSIANTSIGQRLEMWRAAWHLFLRHPLLGVGTGAYQPETQRLIARGEVASFVGDYDHPHNDYLNALASFGIVGFLALLAVLLLPCWFFMRAVRSNERISHALGLAGALTVMGFAIYALTDVVFLHNMMIIWYVVYVALFFALIQARNEKRNNGVA